MRIVLDGCEIRSFVPRDATALVKYGDNPNIARHLRARFPRPYSRADALAFLDQVKAQSPETTFAIATSGELIGSIGLGLQEDVHRHAAEVGFWLGEPHWGKGLATQAVKAMVVHGFNTLGLLRIYAHVFEGNQASMRVLEKAGFTLEGRLRKAILKEGRLLDQLVYGFVKP